MDEKKLADLIKHAGEAAQAYTRQKARYPMSQYRELFKAEDYGGDWALCGCVDFWTLKSTGQCELCHGTGRRRIQREYPGRQFL